MNELTKNEPVEAFGSFPIDVFEGERGTLIRADLPGVRREDLSVALDGEELTIEGRRSLRGESIRLRRRFRVAQEEVDADAIVAKLEDGELSLDLPKPAERQPRRIEVQIG